MKREILSSDEEDASLYEINDTLDSDQEADDTRSNASEESDHSGIPSLADSEAESDLTEESYERGVRVYRRKDREEIDPIYASDSSDEVCDQEA